MGSPVCGACDCHVEKVLPGFAFILFYLLLQLLWICYLLLIPFYHPVCVHEEWCFAFLRAEYHLIVSHRSWTGLCLCIWCPLVCLGPIRTNVWPVIGICCRCLKEQEECANRTIGVLEPWRDKGHIHLSKLTPSLESEGISRSS